MRVLFRGDSDALRTSFSFSTSGLIHGALLALVAFGGTSTTKERPKSLYDTAIRPHEKQIVWYHAPERLPDVRPPSAATERRPLRATRIAPQRIVAGARDDARPPQLVWAPPSIELPKAMPLPNLLAVEMKAPPRPFTPPPAKAIPAPPLDLPVPETPSVAPAAAGATLPPLRRTFTPPPAKGARSAAAVLPEADAVEGLNGAAPAGPTLAPLKRTFTPPPARTAGQPALVLPEAEAVAGVRGAAPAGSTLAPLRRTFTAPAGKSAAAPTPVLPDAEAVAGVGGAAPAGPSLAPLRKTFTPPPARPAADAGATPPDLPDLPAARIAIVGLDPSRTPTLPDAPPPREAGFSASPKLQPDGAATDGATPGVIVPGVTVRDGPTRQSLLAAIRPMAMPLPPAGPLPTTAPATRVASAPDPMLEGRTVYSVAIQMPNITSYSGSWLVWFAERQQSAGGAMRPPSPVRKVDPKYVASAAAEGVQGVVRLGAVIRRDGRVEDVKLLRRLDDRLDRSAMESLAKWQFEPASRGGSPVDVDAVFEIPFRLAPKPLK
jgi:TonB family protein